MFLLLSTYVGRSIVGTLLEFMNSYSFSADDDLVSNSRQ